MFLSEVLFAQDSLKTVSYQSHFQKNLNELVELQDLAEQNINNFQIEKKLVTNFNNAYQTLNLTFFETPVAGAEDFYNLLNNLPEKYKEQLIGNFYIYDNYFSEILVQAGLPPELKYLAPAFSAMNRNALGEDGRSGVWQLTHFQGIINGLTINRLVDERLNDRLAAKSYINELQQNIQIFGTVELALLAQWYGRTKVQNAISFAGDKKLINEVLHYFPESAMDKIGAFQAMAVFLNKNVVIETHGTIVENQIPDTVLVFNQLHLKQISEVLNISEKQLESLNPQFRFKIVPASNNGYKLALPNGFKADYFTLQDSIFNSQDSTLFEITAQTIEYPPVPTRQYLGEPVKNLKIEGKTKIKYLLKTGDVLGIIAEKYDVQVEDLKYWNNISNERRIQAGKNIDIFIDNDQVDYYLNLEKNVQENKTPLNNFALQFQQAIALEVLEDLKDTPKIEYEVKSGESPYTIAKKFKGITPDEILLWNNIDDARKIQIGQKLIIYLKE